MVLSWNKGKWIHSHETLINSKVAYIVKLVGVVEVNDARGMEIVKEALQKLKFSRHIKRSEGTKPPKVELSINVQGLKLSDIRTKEVMHDIKLHHVSFCADDKEDKRMFSFIAKGKDGKHLCYGLDSLHEANDITLTIGQAFELAYDRYLKTDKGMATSKQVVDLNKRIVELEAENAKLKQRIVQLETGKSPPLSLGNSPSRTVYTPTKTASDDPDTLEPSSSSNIPEKPAAITRKSPPIRQVSLSEQSSSGSEYMTSTDLLNIFNDPALSHAPINKKYLESRFNSPNLPPAKRIQKQAYIDQTIASVERAKASLKNLKDFVNQRKLRKKQKPNVGSSPVRKQEDQIHIPGPRHQEDEVEDDNYAKISDIQESAAKYLSQSLQKSEAQSQDQANEQQVSRPNQYNSLPPNLAKRESQMNAKPAGRRSSASSLYTGFNEVIGTLQSMIVDTPITSAPSNAENKQITAKRDKSPTAEQTFSSDMPETLIDDTTEDRSYMNVSYAKIQAKYKHMMPDEKKTDVPPALPPRDHPMIPPKPPQFLQEALSTKSSSMCSLSNFSATSSDVSSSTDRHGVHSYCFDSPEGSLYMNPGTSGQLIPRQTSPLITHNKNARQIGASTSVLDSTLDKFSGEDGYLLLKEARKIAETSLDDGSDNVDSTYDTVHSLMKSVRKEARQVSWLKSHESTWKASKNLVTADDLDGQDLIDILTEAEKFSQPSATSKETYMSSSSSASFSKPSLQEKQTLRQSKSTTKASTKQSRDAFDMQPFGGATKTTKNGSPIIRLPSPDEVHPVKTPKRRASKQQTDLGKQLFDDPLGELTRLNIQMSQPDVAIKPEENYENQSEILRKIIKSSKLAWIMQEEEKSLSQQKTVPHSNQHDSNSVPKELAGNRKRVKQQGKKKQDTAKPTMQILEPEISLDAFDPLK